MTTLIIVFEVPIENEWVKRGEVTMEETRVFYFELFSLLERNVVVIEKILSKTS